jgi:hypothetical protein
MNLNSLFKLALFLWQTLDKETIARLVGLVQHAIGDLKQVWDFVLQALEEFQNENDDPEVYASQSFESKAAKLAADHPMIVKHCADQVDPKLIGINTPFLDLLKFIIANRETIMEIVEWVKEIIQMFQEGNETE